MTTRTISLKPRLLSQSLSNLSPMQFKSVPFGYDSTFTGVENPLWRSQIRAGVQAGTNASGRFLGIRKMKPARISRSFWTHPTSTDKSTYFRQGWFVGTTSGLSAHFQFAESNASLLQSADNDAVARLYDAIRNIRRVIPQGENLGQIKQTYDQIVKPMAGIQDLAAHVMGSQIEQLKKLSFRNVKAVSRALGAAVIEWRFGVEPLIKDLADASVALANRDNIVNLVPFISKGRRFAYVDSGSERYTENGLDTSGCFFRCAWQNNQSARVRYKGALRIRTDVPNSLADTLGLSWSEVFPTAWNLVPWSFLLDYVSNVGSMLDVFSVPWSDVAWCIKTVRQSATFDGTFGSFDGLDANGNLYPYRVEVNAMTPGMLSYTSTAFSRTIVTELPVQRLEFRLPNSRALQNSAALLASRFKILGGVLGVRRSSVGRRLANVFNQHVTSSGLKTVYPP